MESHRYIWTLLVVGAIIGLIAVGNSVNDNKELEAKFNRTIEQMRTDIKDVRAAEIEATTNLHGRLSVLRDQMAAQQKAIEDFEKRLEDLYTFSWPDKTDAQEFEKWKPKFKLPVARVPHVQAAPKVDGKIDKVYEKLATPMEFKFIGGSGGKPEKPTTAYLVSDQRYLYIAVRCGTPEPDKVVANRTTHDEDVWMDEAIDIYIDPKNSRTFNYFHIIVNAKGVTRDARYQTDLSWEPKLIVKCGKVPKKAWVMEMAIPLKDLGVDPKKVRKIWSFNITRIARDATGGGGPEDTAWSPTLSSSSHVPGRFGYLWMGVAGTPDPEELEKMVKVETKKKKAEVEETWW
jgi:hypothetical protein